MGLDKEALERMDSTEDIDAEAVVETSPCGRWEKHRKELPTKDFPGVDRAYLAMDTEEGVEVVWNEVFFHEDKDCRKEEESIKLIFDNMRLLDHPNIVKFHRHWIDARYEPPRLVLITEYMISGSLKAFLKKNRANNKSVAVRTWKRWCREILLALSYLHDCDPPVVYGNICCEALFIHHNGLMKLGCIAPDMIVSLMKPSGPDRRHAHYIAPEYSGHSLLLALSSADYGRPEDPVNCAADVYSFGMVALEMAALELCEVVGGVCPEMVAAALERVDSEQRDLIQQCLRRDPADRPSVRDLLVHRVLREVPMLKVLAAHSLIDAGLSLPESLEEFDPDKIMASITFRHREPVIRRYCDTQSMELEKFVDEIRAGVHLITGIEPRRNKRIVSPKFYRPIPSQAPTATQSNTTAVHEVSTASSAASTTNEESRRVLSVTVDLTRSEEASGRSVTLRLRMQGGLHRVLVTALDSADTADCLVNDLIKHGLLNPNDRSEVARHLNQRF